jgi:hypothetical protein
VHKLPSSHARQSFIHRDLRHPLCKGRLTSELMQIFPSANIRLLRDIFGFGCISHNRPRSPVHALIVTSHQEFVNGAVTTFHKLHELLVRQSRKSYFLLELHFSIELDAAESGSSQ